MFSMTFPSQSIGSQGTVGKTTRFCSGRYGFGSQPPSAYFIITITSENFDIASFLMCMKSFQTRDSLEPGRVPLRSFSVMWDKEIPTQNRKIPLPLLCIMFFITRFFLKHRRVPAEFFWHCEGKKFRQRIVIPSSNI